MLKRNNVPGHIFSAQFEAELKFRVVEVDPVSGDIEGEEDGFPEEYPLEDVELSTADFMRKVSSTQNLIVVKSPAQVTDADFRTTWDSLGKSGEVLEKFGLQFKELDSATAAVIDCLGMQCVTNSIRASTLMAETCVGYRTASNLHLQSKKWEFSTASILRECF